MNTTEYLSKWAISYKDDIINNIMPFWMKYGLDREHGGVYTCVNRDGSLIDTTKSVWFQGRFGFIAAYAYNNIEKNPQWLAASKSCIDFIEAHCFDTDGHMFFEVTEDGKPLRKRRYVFSEGFAAIAMAEYALATGEKEYAKKALDIFKRTLHFLNTPGFLEPKYLPTLPSRGHSKILDWSWEWGWDKEFGGIINFRDCRNLPVQDYSQDMKFWWPQTEAIIATLYAYQATGDEKYLQMHQQVSDWAYAHFPDKEYGEWYGYLHRDGTVAQPAKGNLFKGPFHIPRMMIRGYMLCKELL